jgi:TPR repeat protein
VPKDFAKAAEWFRKAADQGDASSQFILGEKYKIGRGVSKDYIESYKWFNLAASQGFDKAAEARDLAARLLKPKELADGQRRASVFDSKKSSSSKEAETNVVVSPERKSAY